MMRVKNQEKARSLSKTKTNYDELEWAIETPELPLNTNWDKLYISDLRKKGANISQVLK